jgi:hypothetical protein
MVVPLSFASLADRLWADGQAATVHKSRDASHPPPGAGAGFTPSAEQMAEQMKACANAIVDLLGREDNASSVMNYPVERTICREGPLQLGMRSVERRDGVARQVDILPRGLHLGGTRTVQKHEVAPLAPST